MTPARNRWLVAVAVCSLGLSGCKPAGDPDVVVITLDTVRADRLGGYGNRSGLTPALDRFAARGVLFADASCAVPLTLPSHANLFTGRYPTATGVRNNGSFVLPESETTLAERLAARGFHTGAVIAAYPLQARYGLAQGFAIYDESLPRRSLATTDAFAVHFEERSAKDVTDRALDVWARLGGRPRFLWVHYFDAHAPYAAPPPWGLAHADAPYDGEIAYVDAEAGRLLARLERDAPDAIVVIAGDHGEGLGEHGEKTHGIFLYQSTLHVPLVIAAPGRWPAGSRVVQPVTLSDVVPTILALLHVPVPPELDGTDLAPAVYGATLLGREVYAESYLPFLQFRFSPLTMLRGGSLKWIDAPSIEVYDLASDPGETRNLAGTSTVDAGLASRLAAVLASADPAAGERAAGHADAEAEARLRSLGYAAAGGPGDRRRGRGRDPKSMTDYLERYDQAVGLQAAGRFDEGSAALRSLVPEAPENYMVRYQLAAGLLAAGRPDEAERELRQVIAAAPEFGNAYFMLGDCLFALGRVDDAVSAFEAASLRMPTQAEPHIAQGRALAARGRFEPAAAAYRAAVAAEPTSTEAARSLLALYSGRGELPRAVRELHELASKCPMAAGLQTVLAEALYQAGDASGAAATLRHAFALDPARTDARLLEAQMLLDLNHPEDAAAAYRAILRSAPASRAARLGLGRALVLGSSGGEAEAYIAELRAKYPADAAPHLLRGVLLERRGDTEGALIAYREALVLDPRDVDARRGVDRITTRRSPQ
jgi:arylsulfatase A-like enzyme/tetratricopeptide (TPR) repeat protein